MADAALAPSVLGRPLADQFAGGEIVGGEGCVRRVRRIERRIQRDHQDAGLARLLDGRDDGAGIVRRDQNALGAGGDQVFDGRDLAFIVAVDLAREGSQLDVAGLGRFLGAGLHLDKERVGVGLGDEPDDRLVGGESAGRPQSKHERGGKSE